MTSQSSGSAGASNHEVEEWERLARNAALSDTVETEPEMVRELLAFVLNGAPYAVPVERVREIIRFRDITPMPRVPECVSGVLALRGEIVQVIDGRMRLGLELTPTTRRTRIIVLHGEDDRVTGIMVDGVDQVLRVSENEITPATSTHNGVVVELCKRGDEFVSIVDMDEVLDLDAN